MISRTQLGTFEWQWPQCTFLPRHLPELCSLTTAREGGDTGMGSSSSSAPALIVSNCCESVREQLTLQPAPGPGCRLHSEPRNGAGLAKQQAQHTQRCEAQSAVQVRGSARDRPLPLPTEQGSRPTYLRGGLGDARLWMRQRSFKLSWTRLQRSTVEMKNQKLMLLTYTKNDLKVN